MLVSVLILVLLLAANTNSYFLDEPMNDIEYRLKGIAEGMSWVIAIAASILTFIILMLLGWLKAAILGLFNYLNKSAR